MQIQTLSVKGFSGQVVTLIGTPIEKAELRLFRQTEAGMVLEYLTVADEEGRFSILGVKAGIYRLWVDRENFQRFSFEIKIKKGVDKRKESEVTLELAKMCCPGNIRVRKTTS